jgi:hypothetical protein
MWLISKVGYFDVFSAFYFRCKVPKLDCIIYIHPQKQLQRIFSRKCWAVLECDGYEKFFTQVQNIVKETLHVQSSILTFPVEYMLKLFLRMHIYIIQSSLGAETLHLKRKAENTSK